MFQTVDSFNSYRNTYFAFDFGECQKFGILRVVSNIEPQRNHIKCPRLQLYDNLNNDIAIIILR